MPCRYLERGLSLLGDRSQYTPRRHNVPYRHLERRIGLLGGGGYVNSTAGAVPGSTPKHGNMPCRYLERRLALLGGGSQYTPRRRDVPYRPLERGLSLLGGGGCVCSMAGNRLLSAPRLASAAASRSKQAARARPKGSLRLLCAVDCEILLNSGIF